MLWNGSDANQIKTKLHRFLNKGLPSIALALEYIHIPCWLLVTPKSDLDSNFPRLIPVRSNKPCHSCNPPKAVGDRQNTDMQRLGNPKPPYVIWAILWPLIKNPNPISGSKIQRSFLTLLVAAFVECPKPALFEWNPDQDLGVVSWRALVHTLFSLVDNQQLI